MPRGRGFKRMLSYKAMTRGGMCLKVNEAYTSQVCSRCRAVPGAGREVSQDLEIRTWNKRMDLRRLRSVHHRDVNARNILRLGLETRPQEDPMSEDAGKLRRSGRGAVTKSGLCLADWRHSLIVPCSPATAARSRNLFVWGAYRGRPNIFGLQPYQYYF
jgi:transposase